MTAVTPGGRSGRARVPAAGAIALPHVVGAGRSPLERFCSHATQWSHQVPRCSSVVASHSSGSAGGVPFAVRYDDFGLPGGLTMAWMWPLELSTKSVSPPVSCVVRYAARHGTMWSVDPATTYVSMSTACRSAGVPSTVIVPSARPLEVNRSRKSEWRPAGSLVVSAFQKRMSNGGGFWPSR